MSGPITAAISSPDAIPKDDIGRWSPASRRMSARSDRPFPDGTPRHEPLTMLDHERLNRTQRDDDIDVLIVRAGPIRMLSCLQITKAV